MTIRPENGSSELKVSFFRDPIISDFVANSITHLRVRLEQATDDYSASDRNVLLGAFRSISQIDTIGTAFGSGSTTFGEVHTILAPYTGDKIKLPYGVDDRFNEFVEDLELLSIFEQEGIDGINHRLEAIFKELRNGAHPEEEQKQLIMDANRFLYRAIYLFPHMVSSVEVKVDKDAAGKSEQMWKEFYDPYRYQYEQLKEERVKRGDKNPDTLVIPLPYGFTTGTHGSGERAAMVSSRREIYFAVTDRKESRDYIPALMVTIDSPLILSHETLFLLDEINTIQLSPRHDFTPYFDRHKGPHLSDRGHHVEYYLMFRGFGNYGNGRKFKGEVKPTILEPYKSDRTLWDGSYQGFMTHGFFIHYSHQPEDVVMYEVIGYQMKGSAMINDEAIAKMEEEVMNRDVEQQNKSKDLVTFVQSHSYYKRYTGNDIISRLMQIPVQPRIF